MLLVHLIAFLLGQGQSFLDLSIRADFPLFVGGYAPPDCGFTFHLYPPKASAIGGPTPNRQRCGGCAYRRRALRRTPTILGVGCKRQRKCQPTPGLTGGSIGETTCVGMGKLCPVGIQEITRVFRLRLRLLHRRGECHSIEESNENLKSG